MKHVIETNKYVELTYKVFDQKSGQVLTSVEFPLGYVHGVIMVLSPLVITEYIRNVPEEYREVGTAILMENDRGETKTFLVTRKDRKTITMIRTRSNANDGVLAISGTWSTTIGNV
jgi:FKBP-type peptidyl-prolyl cis-trans isomerase SlyD